MAKLTAVVKSPEEILGPGAKGVISFRVGNYSDPQGLIYTENMAKLAGTRIEVEMHPNGRCGGRGWEWLKEWLRDFEEEVDWSKVPVDTKVLANGYKRHFAKYENGLVHVWVYGMTSFTAGGYCTPWAEVRLYREDNQ